MTDRGLLAQWKSLLAATRDPRLARADLACLGSVLDRMNAAGVSWPSLKCIAQDAGVNRRTAARSVDRLTGTGYLGCERGDRITSNRYFIGTARSGESAPTASDGFTPTGSGESTTGVVANSPLQVVANPPPEFASLNLPNEPASKNSVAIGSVDRFKEFRETYPRKAAWPAAEKAWRKNRCDRHADKILADVRARVADPGQWADANFIPYPATYLNARRWEDEWTPAKGSTGILPRDEADDDLAAFNAEAALRIGGGHG